LSADMADGENLGDLKLMDGIERGHCLAVRSLGLSAAWKLCWRGGGRTQHHFKRSDCFAMTPAARITLITPATKPTSTNTMRPHGLVGKTRSHAQPRTAPTT